MGKRPFVGFAREDFAQTAQIFRADGYRSVYQVRDMGPKERDFLLQETKTGQQGRAIVDVGFTFNPQDIFSVRSERTWKGG